MDLDTWLSGATIVWMWTSWYVRSTDEYQMNLSYYNLCVSWRNRQEFSDEINWFGKNIFETGNKM